MLRIVSLFSLLSFGFAIHRTRCGLETDIGTTFMPTEDGVEGRYNLEWCSKLPDDSTMWKLQFESIATKKCKRNINIMDIYMLKRNKGTIHSVVTESINGTIDCNVTCLSTTLDLVFSGCYLIENQVSVGKFNKHVERAMLPVTNRFAGQGAFNNLQTYYTIEKDGDSLTVRWDLHYIPVSNYSMEISTYIKENQTYVSWSAIQNCSHDTYSLTCSFLAPAPERCVAAKLQLAAPWLRGPLFEDEPVMIYCSPVSPQVSVKPAASSSAAWWAGGAALGVLLLPAALYAAHSRVLRDLRKRTVRDWTQRYSQYKAARALRPDEPSQILLLYAQDCAPAMRAVAALRDMLEAGAPGRVLDLFAPECVAQYAPAPLEWLRGVLERPDVKVVLVQTPAAAALYDAPLDENNLRLQEPLLGRVVQYRAPHYADALLQYALRLVRDTAHARPEYTKYYIATISSLQSELVPLVAAYRRYMLPEHAISLLLDLRLCPEHDTTRVRTLAAAVTELVDFVKGRPDYLKDELEYLQQV